jgi:hypothetical protein
MSTDVVPMFVARAPFSMVRVNLSLAHARAQNILTANEVVAFSVRESSNDAGIRYASQFLGRPTAPEDLEQP